jgi:D-alanyl-D-alanine carboxypeptidase
MRIKSIFIMVVGISLLFLSCQKNDFIENMGVSVNMPENTYSKGAAVQAVLDKYVRLGIPGVTICIDDPVNGFWAGASGKACIEDNSDMTKNHIMSIGSIAKTYTNVLTLKLMEMGHIALDDPISTYLTKDIYQNVTNSEIITVRQLMNHSSGLSDYGDDTYLNLKMLDQNFSGMTEKDFRDALYRCDALFVPGERFSYSSSGAYLLTLIIDNTMGQSHADLLSEYILIPHNYGHTYYKNYPEFPKPTGIANFYMDRYNIGKIENITEPQIDLVSVLKGSDGIYTTMYDLNRFFKDIFSGNILEQASIDQMLDGITIAPEEWLDDGISGLGIFSGYCYDDVMCYKHGGVMLGSNASAYYFPDSGITMTLSANIGGQIWCDLADLYVDGLLEDILEVLFKD